MEKTFSRVMIRETSEIKEVDIFTESSVKFGDAVLTRWQNSIDLVAKLSNVPAVLVMRLYEKEIEIFLSSRSPGNPYQHSTRDELLEGFYCETVIGTGSSLTVTDALKDPAWKENPDVKLNMISYLGFPLQWPDGEMFGTICILNKQPGYFSADAKDLLVALKQSFETDLSLLLAQFNLAKSEQRYKIINDEKDRFFSILAHDLRAPFTPLLGFSEVLIEMIESGDRDDQLALAKRLHNSASGVFSLLENLLDWSRLQRSNIAYQSEEVDVSALVTKVVHQLEISIDAKNLNFMDQTAPGIIFRADPYMLAGMIRNLLTNAIKFTGRGGSVTLRISTEDGKLFIEVEDTGTGIAPDILDKLFTNDLRGTRGTEDEPSSGLGLIIVKEFVDKHGGTITVTSEVNQGTKFTVKLPDNL